MTNAPIDHAEQNARGWMETITDAIRKLDADVDARDEELREEIEQMPLSVMVRCSDWFSPGSTDERKPDEFEILLSTGAPALRVTGSLDRYMQPEDVRLQKQDWGTPWTDVRLSLDEIAVLDRFASHFYFGE